MPAASNWTPSVTVATIGGWPSVVFVSTLAFAAIAYGASFLVQPTYRSTVRFLVVPSKIQLPFVESPAGLVVESSPRQRVI